MVDGRNDDSPAFNLELMKEGQLPLGTKYTNNNNNNKTNEIQPTEGREAGKRQGRPFQ